MTDYTGQMLGGYKIRELLGRGAMGAVYLAEQVALGREVAVKVLEKSELSDPAAAQRFQGEARAVAALNHPNVMGVYDVGETDSCQFMAMELIDGESMGMRIKKSGRFEADEVMDFGIQSARGLAAAHAQGLIHRDIKPDNILLTSSGVAKVADFGLAKQQDSDIHLTKTGAIYGSPAYMSPEQCQGIDLTPATDIYSLGVTLYACISGDAPFDATSAVGVMMKHVAESPEFTPAMRERCSQQLLEVVERCLAKDPAERWPSAAALADVLERVRRGESLTPDELIPASEFHEQLVAGQRPTWLVPTAIGGIVLMCAIGFGVLSKIGEDPARSQGVSAATDDPAEQPATASNEEVVNPQVEAPAPSDPVLDQSKIVLEAMGAERRGELAKARSLLEQANAMGDLEALSADAALVLANLQAWDGFMAASAAAIVDGDMPAAQAALGSAHALYRTGDSIAVKTDLDITAGKLATVKRLVAAGQVAEARDQLSTLSEGMAAFALAAGGARFEQHLAALETADRAMDGRAWDAAAEALALAQGFENTTQVQVKLAALGEFKEALAAAAKATDALTRIEALERAAAIHADGELLAQIQTLREELGPTPEEVVMAAVAAAVELETAGDLAGARQALTEVSAHLVSVDDMTRRIHATTLARLEIAARPQLLIRQSIPAANRIFTEAEKLRKTPMTIFSDKNERKALGRYEDLIARYPSSDKIGDAYYGAAHVAENLDLDSKAALYWEKAATNGYHDPVECYILAGDTVADELGDKARAKRLLQQAMKLCKDNRQKKIRGLLEDLGS